MELDLVLYACVAHNHKVQSSTILAEFNSADSSLQTLAHQCLHKAPPHHSIFSHSYKNHTYTFLLDVPFVYFGIFNPKMCKPDQIRFLGRLKEALNCLVKLNPDKKFTPHCYQGELHPIFTKMGQKSHDLDPLHVGHSVNPLPNVSGSISPSSRARKIFSVPVLNSCKMGKGVKKNNGLYLNEGGGGNGGRLKAKKIWRRHVWIVLGLDLAVCLILFGIWLFVCRGFECIER